MCARTEKVLLSFHWFYQLYWKSCICWDSIENCFLHLKCWLCGVKLQIIQTTYPKKEAIKKIKQHLRVMTGSKSSPSDMTWVLVCVFFRQGQDWKASVLECWRSSQPLRVSSIQQHECTSICCPHVVDISTAFLCFLSPPWNTHMQKHGATWSPEQTSIFQTIST